MNLCCDQIITKVNCRLTGCRRHFAPIRIMHRPLTVRSSVNCQDQEDWSSVNYGSIHCMLFFG